jgi:hypothetical protein
MTLNFTVALPRLRRLRLGFLFPETDRCYDTDPPLGFCWQDWCPRLSKRLHRSYRDVAPKLQHHPDCGFGLALREHQRVQARRVQAKEATGRPVCLEAGWGLDRERRGGWRGGLPQAGSAGSSGANETGVELWGKHYARTTSIYESRVEKEAVLGRI